MRRLDLVPDCGSCAAICCVATSFDASEHFAFTKAAGVPCRHLTADYRCAVHAELRARGLHGCAAYDCYGAGQRATRAFAGERGADRRRDASFAILRDIHELLWLLTESAKLCPSTDGKLCAEIAAEISALDALAGGPLEALFVVDLAPLTDRAHAVLRRLGRAIGGRRRVRGLTVVR